jgi:hypothetical protein
VVQPFWKPDACFSVGVFGFYSQYDVIFQVLTATSMKMAVFWDVALCSLADIDDVLQELTASIVTVMSTKTQRNLQPSVRP